MRETFSADLVKNFFLVIRKKWGIIVLVLLIFLGWAFFINKTTIPIYEASSTVLVNPALSGNTDYGSIVAGERLTTTYSNMITTNTFMEEVLKKTELAKDFSLSGMRGKIKVAPIPNTQLLAIRASDPDPQQAATIANAVAETLIEENQRMQLERGLLTKKQLEEEINSYRANIAETQGKIEGLGSGDQLVSILYQDRLRNLQATLIDLLKQYEEIRLNEQQSLNTVTIVDEAIVPDTPVKPRPRYNLMISFFLGIVVSFGGVIILELLDPSIKREEEIEKTLGLPILGSIEKLSSSRKEKPLVLVEDAKSPVSEGFRMIRTNIKFSSPDKPVKSILVTSSVPQEGKSFVTANLAGAFSTADQKTVLVDSDLRKPTLHHFFNLSNSKGLTDILLKGEIEKDDVQAIDGFPYLRFIASGFLPPNPAELLGSKKLTDVFERLTKQTDMVIVDSPPTNLVTDAAILGTQVDGVIIVAELGKTNRYLIRKTKESLNKVGANILGVVLNRAAKRRGYYKSGYYYGHKTEPKPEKPKIKVSTY